MISIENMRNRSIERPGGSSIIAQFDADVGALKLHGCSIIRHQDGFTKVALPAGRTRRAVSIIDPAFEDEFRSAALRAYGATAEPAPLCESVEDALNMAGI